MIGFVYEYGLIVAALAVLLVICWLLVGRWIAGRRSDGPAWDPSDPWAGTSPAEEGATLDLTPTEFMPRAPVTLEDGTVVGTPNRPTMKEIEADAEHAIKALLDEKLAESRRRLDLMEAAFRPIPTSPDYYRRGWAEYPTAAYPVVA